METVETINLVDEYNKLKTENEQLREALSEAIEFADQDYHALTPTGETMISRWRSALQQKDTEKLSQMMIRCGLVTGHGDTIDDLIFELEKQIKNTSHAFSDALKEIEQLRLANLDLQMWFDYAKTECDRLRGSLAFISMSTPLSGQSWESHARFINAYAINQLELEEEE